MRTPVKITLAWTMLLLMTYNMVGYFIIFSLAEIENRIEMEKSLEDEEDSDLVLFTFTKTAHGSTDSFIRKNPHEIIVDGKIYDVKNEITKNGSIYFYCIHDSKEEQLNKQLTENIHLSTGTSNHHNNTTKTTGKNVLPEFTFSKSISFFNNINRILIFSIIDKNSSAGVDDIIPPPPRG